MATRTLTHDIQDLAYIANNMAKERRNLIHKQLPFYECAKMVHGDGKPSVDGGEKFLVTAELFEHSASYADPTGFLEVPLDYRVMERVFEFNPGWSVAPIIIMLRERNKYGGSDAYWDAAKERIRSVIQMHMRNWHLQMLSGGAPGFANSGWATLNGIDSGGATTDGYLEEDAHGSQGNTVGGLSKSTFSAVPGMNNWAFNLQGKVGTNGRDLIREGINTRDEYDTDTSKVKGFCTIKMRGYLDRILEPAERYVLTSQGGDKRTPAELLGVASVIGGVEVFQTSDLPTSGSTTATSPLSLLLHDFGAIYPQWMRGAKEGTDGYFGVDDWKEIGGGHRGLRAFCDCNGQLIANSFHTTALWYDGETF